MPTEVLSRNVQVLSSPTGVPMDFKIWKNFPDTMFRDFPRDSRLEFGKYAPPSLLRLEIHLPHSGRWWLVSNLRTPGLLGIKQGGHFIGYFGNSLPFERQPVAVHNLSIPLNFNHSTDTLYILALEDQGPCALKLHFTPDYLFPEEVEQSAILGSLPIGYFLAILVVALFLWGAVRERAFGWYAAYLFFAVLWVSTKNGLSFAYLWPTQPSWNPLASVCMSFGAVGCFALFLCNILSLSKKQPLLSHLVCLAACLEFFFSLVSLCPRLTMLPAMRAAAQFSMGGTLLLLPCVLVIRTWKQDAFARQILFAFQPLLLAMIFGLAIEFGFTVQGPAVKTVVMVFAAATENTLTTLILVREVYRRERERVLLERNFHREVVERSDRHLNWISQELHDDLGQQVSSLRMQVFSRRSNMPEKVQEELEKKLESLALGIRSLSHHLHPSALDDRGIETALRELCGDLAKLSAADVCFQTEGILPKFSRSESTHIYRIAQEALNNAMRHGSPNKIDVIVFSKGNHARMEIVDDGKGFNPDHAVHGIGLAGIRSRVEAIGGHLQIESHAGKGTRLCIEIVRKI